MTEQHTKERGLEERQRTFDMYLLSFKTDIRYRKRMIALAENRYSSGVHGTFWDELTNAQKFLYIQKMLAVQAGLDTINIPGEYTQ